MLAVAVSFVICFFNKFICFTILVHLFGSNYNLFIINDFIKVSNVTSKLSDTREFRNKSEIKIEKMTKETRGLRDETKNQ